MARQGWNSTRERTIYRRNTDFVDYIAVVLDKKVALCGKRNFGVVEY